MLMFLQNHFRVLNIVKQCPIWVLFHIPQLERGGGGFLRSNKHNDEMEIWSMTIKPPIMPPTKMYGSANTTYFIMGLAYQCDSIDVPMRSYKRTNTIYVDSIIKMELNSCKNNQIVIIWLDSVESAMVRWGWVVSRCDRVDSGVGGGKMGGVRVGVWWDRMVVGY
ncbi:hypothetical protein LXL04_011697 [Taraxacum kok-saghyz]